MRSGEFIRLYKELEDVLEEKYSGQKRHHSSVIFEYINDPESEPVRRKLDLCREIRNLLTHNAELDGEPIVEPSQPVLRALQDVLAYVQKPPLAIEYATPISRILCAGLSDRVLQVMRCMEKNGFSHIPVLENRRFLGVFSAAAVFSAVLREPGLRITEETDLRTLGKVLSAEQISERYAFVGRNTGLTTVRQMFEKPVRKNNRLSVVFVTENGRPHEALLGMLTPWDVLKEE